MDTSTIIISTPIGRVKIGKNSIRSSGPTTSVIQIEKNFKVVAQKGLVPPEKFEKNDSPEPPAK